MTFLFSYSAKIKAKRRHSFLFPNFYLKIAKKQLTFLFVLVKIYVTEPTTHKAATHCGPRWDFFYALSANCSAQNFVHKFTFFYAKAPPVLQAVPFGHTKRHKAIALCLCFLDEEKILWRASQAPASLRVAPCPAVGVWSQRILPPQRILSSLAFIVSIFLPFVKNYSIFQIAFPAADTDLPHG